MKPSQLLPLNFNKFSISTIDWSDFTGKVDQSMPWSAHIYWQIQYRISDQKKKKIEASVNMSAKSWARNQKKCDHLLNHQQGHYLIGCLCTLQFLRRIDAKKHQSQQKFEDLLVKTFDRTVKEYLELEKKYDIQTEHRMNYKKQQQWDAFIYDRLSYYRKIYDKTKNKFVKFADSVKNKKS